MFGKAICSSFVALAAGAAVFAATPYDAQVEYLYWTKPAKPTGVPYIDTGLLPADDMGAHVRFSPLQSASDSVLFGSKGSTAKNWYFGGSTTFYLSWNSNPAPNTRPSLAVGSVYDVFLNYMNDRNRRIAGVEGAKVNATADEYNLAITEVWNAGKEGDKSIWLFTFNNNGAPYVSYGAYRIYSAVFTRGGKVVMDLVPVRKGGVGYLYDRVNGLMLGKSANADGPAFQYGGDVADGGAPDSARVIEGAVTLDADADWTADGMVKIADDAVIDLNGHTLAVVGAYGSGTITDTSAGAPGELHFVVPERGDVVVDLALTGNLTVVKDGAGRLSLARTGQTFTGGVLVAGGTAYATAAESGSCWGPSGGTVAVAAGGTFDANGKNDLYFKNFVVSGGTLANTASMAVGAGKYGFGNVTLAADSALKSTRSILTLFEAPDGVAAKIDLGGHVLTNSMEYGGNVFLHIPAENGTMVCEKLTDGAAGGYLNVAAGKSGGSPTLNLEMVTSALWFDGTLAVSNYTARYTGGYNHGAAAIRVHGTFTPAAVTADGKECFHGCEMQSGSKMDLSAKDGAWVNVATGWAGTGDADGNRTVTFADGAAVTIDVHGRALAKGDRIVKWDAPPENAAFAFDAATAGSGEAPFPAANGLYYGADETVVATARWTGAANDGAVDNPRNWACTNFMGRAVADGLPGAVSAVRIAGDVNIQIPVSKTLAFETLHLEGVRLSADCDWRGLAVGSTDADAVAAFSGSIDLNGHELRIKTPDAKGFAFDCVELSVADGSSGAPGELHVEVPNAESYVWCDGMALSGNLKLVKDGAGFLTMTRPGQTFSGGVLIAEGTGYSRLGDFPEDRGYWGPDGGTIAVGAGGAFDAYGNYGFHRKNFVLAGGTLANTANMPQAAGRYGIGNVTLAADSVLKSTRSILTLFEAPAGAAAQIDLGGHVLTNSMEYGGNVFLHIPAENGTMVCEKLTDGAAGGYLNVAAGKSGGSPTLNLEMVTSALWFDGTLAVSNYTARYTGGYNHGAAAIRVHGTFTPAAVTPEGKECFHGCEMQGGSKIDLSAKDGAWANVATGWAGTGNTDGNRTMTFADGAEVDVLLGSRRLKSLERVMDWSLAVPPNREGLKFRGVAADGRRFALRSDDEGVYVPKGGFVVVLR